jgi:hypothetical protein
MSVYLYLLSEKREQKMNSENTEILESLQSVQDVPAETSLDEDLQYAFDCLYDND